MKHYIIVKFKNNYNYKYEINNIKNLFDEAKKQENIFLYWMTFYIIILLS